MLVVGHGRVLGLGVLVAVGGGRVCRLCSLAMVRLWLSFFWI
jgi:hypothetical protein